MNEQLDLFGFAPSQYIIKKPIRLKDNTKNGLKIIVVVKTKIKVYLIILFVYFIMLYVSQKVVGVGLNAKTYIAISF